MICLNGLFLIVANIIGLSGQTIIIVSSVVAALIIVLAIIVALYARGKE